MSENDFNRGIAYAFDYIRKNMYGRVVNGHLKGAATKEDLDRMEKEIAKKCNFCPKPCETEHCCTKKEEKDESPKCKQRNCGDCKQGCK